MIDATHSHTIHMRFNDTFLGQIQDMYVGQLLIDFGQILNAINYHAILWIPVTSLGLPITMYGLQLFSYCYVKIIY